MKSESKGVVKVKCSVLGSTDIDIAMIRILIWTQAHCKMELIHLKQETSYVCVFYFTANISSFVSFCTLNQCNLILQQCFCSEAITEEVQVGLLQEFFTEPLDWQALRSWLASESVWSFWDWTDGMTHQSLNFQSVISSMKNNFRSLRF